MDARTIPPRYQQMMNAQGFRDMVNSKYQEALREDPKAFRLDSFDNLNEEYRNYFGFYRYIDYDSFTAAERRARKDIRIIEAGTERLALKHLTSSIKVLLNEMTKDSGSRD